MDILDLAAEFHKECRKAAAEAPVNARNLNANGRAWPVISAAAGVLPSQIDEAQAHSRQIGIPTDFTPDGDVVFTDAAHRKRYCQAIGLYDRNGGYGDPQRR